MNISEKDNKDIKTTGQVTYQRDIKGGFLVLKSAPSDSFGEEGQIVLRDDGAGNYYIYCKINGSWHYEALT